jgi:hypothetical protein
MFELYDDDEPFRGRLSGKEAPSNERSRTSSSRSTKFGGGSFTKPGSTFSQRAYVNSNFTYSPGETGTSDHTSYLQRDGAGKDGEEPTLFSEDGEEVDADAFAERSADDPHQFRFIVSPENADHLDMPDYVDEWVRQMENDLNQDLDWAAAVHENTDQTHAHVIVRGLDQDGDEVRLSPRYMHHGLRHRAEDIATRHLGPRTLDDKVRQYDREVAQTRVTQADKVLHQTQSSNDADTPVNLDNASPNTPGLTTRHLKQRAQTLERLGLASRDDNGAWSFDEDFLDQLDDLQDVQKRDEHVQEHGYNANTYSTTPPDNSMLARIGGQGISHGSEDNQYVIAEAADGELYHLETSGSRAYEGDIVELQSNEKDNTLERKDLQSPDDAVHADGPTWLDKHIHQQHRSDNGNKVTSKESEAHDFEHTLSDAAEARKDILEGRDLITSEERDQPPADLVKRLREYERQKFAHDLAESENRSVRELSPDSRGRFEGHLSERQTLKGGDVFIARNEDELTVLSANKHLDKHAGERVSIARKEHDGRVRTFVDSVSRDRSGR